MAKKMMDKLKSKIGIAQKDAKNAPASAPGKMRQIVGETCAESAGAVESSEKKNPGAEPQKLIGWLPEIYDDTDVCRALSMRRRWLGRLRQVSYEHEKWDIVGKHAGMTAKWIRETGKISEDEWRKWVEAKGLKRIEPDDGIVTVELKRRHENKQMVTVQILASKELEVCRVRNSEWMVVGEQFDCRRAEGKLYLVESLNTERW